jgi:hypothetical protein
MLALGGTKTPKDVADSKKGAPDFWTTLSLNLA